MKVIPLFGNDADSHADMPEAGRCIYCGERCDIESTYHEYCLEHELDPRTARKSLSRIRHDAMDDAD